MRVIIDNSNLFAGGGIQVAISFLYDLIHENNQYDFYVIQSHKIAPLLNEASFPKNFNFFHIKNTSVFYKRLEVESIENMIKPDVIFSVFGPSYHKSKFPKIVGFAIPHLIYNDSPFFKNLTWLQNKRIRFLSRLKLFAFERYSDALVFETQDSKEIYLKKYKSKKELFVVSNTLNEVFYNKQKWINLNLNLRNTFNILFITANYPHKNLQIIPQIINILKEQFYWNDFRFILTVKKEEMGFDDETNNFIKYLGTIPVESIPNVYEQSDAVFIPTLLEIFSTTYLEAMFMKKPIIASDMSFARDICGNSAIYCEPLNAQNYAESLNLLRENIQFKNEMIQLGTLKLKQYGSSIDRTRKYLEIIRRFALK